MKKIVYTLMLAGSVGLNLYLLNTEVLVSNDLEDDILEIDDEISVAQSALLRKKNKTPNHSKNIKDIRNNFLPETAGKNKEGSALEESKKSRQDYDREFEKAKEEWKEKLTRYMEDELGLEPPQVDQYFDIGQEREGAITRYLAPKFENAKDGPYFFSIEDNVAIGKINEKHLKQLKVEMGEEAYEQYIEYRQEYNKKAMESGNADFFMEF